MNYFTDNEDIQHHFHHGVEWERFVPLLEQGFQSPDGPGSLQEARELYETGLTEAGEYLAREVAPRARAIDEQGVGFEGGEVVHPPGLLENVAGLRRLGVTALTLPREVGGFNFPLTAGAMFVEGLSRACTNTMILYAFYQGPAFMVMRFGTPDQVAERMGEVMEEVGGDGYLITTPKQRLSRMVISEITDGLIPALQRRGLTRDSYNHTHLRDHLREF